MSILPLPPSVVIIRSSDMSEFDSSEAGSLEKANIWLTCLSMTVNIPCR